nr:unnamed protein product [Callosobruchus analis]
MCNQKRSEKAKEIPLTSFLGFYTKSKRTRHMCLYKALQH